MVAWWNSLTGLEQAFAYLAIPATLILVIQTLLLLFGLGHDGGADVDFEPDTSGLDLDGDLPELDGDVPLPGEVDAGTDTIWDGDHVDTAPDAGLRIFTIRGFVAFFSVFGWCGLAMLRGGATPALSVLISFLLGAAAMVAMAALFRLAMKLQSDGTLDLRNALGASGSVYLTIPASRKERGKVNVMVQGQLGEFEAVTDEKESIPTGSEVVVVGITGRSTLVVCRK